MHINMKIPLSLGLDIKKLSDIVGKEGLSIRIPRIPGYNTEADISKSVDIYSSLGEIDEFNYRCER